MAKQKVKLQIELELELTDGKKADVETIKEVVDEFLDGETFYVDDEDGEGEESSFDVTSVNITAL